MDLLNQYGSDSDEQAEEKKDSPPTVEVKEAEALSLNTTGQSTQLDNNQQEESPNLKQDFDNDAKNQSILHENTSKREENKNNDQKTVSLSSLDQFLPPKTNQACSQDLKDKLAKFHDLKLSGKSVLRNLQQSHAFKNPDILEKLILFVGIDETGSNYPIELFNPHGFDESDFYDNIVKEQQNLQEKRDLERQKRPTIDFAKSQPPPSQQQRPITQPASNTTTATNDTHKRERSNRWDQTAEELPLNDTKPINTTSQPQQLANITENTSNNPRNNKKAKTNVKPTTTQTNDNFEASSSYSEFIKEKRREAESRQRGNSFR